MSLHTLIIYWFYTMIFVFCIFISCTSLLCCLSVCGLYTEEYLQISISVYFDFTVFVECWDSVDGLNYTSWFSNPPPPILRLNIAYFAVAEGWLLLDIGWFVLFLLSLPKPIVLSRSAIVVSSKFLCCGFLFVNITEPDISRNIGFHRTSATGVACRQGTFTAPDT